MHLPLTPVVFEILLALADHPQHGYAVMQEVEARSGMRIRAGTLYRAINRMLEEGYIQEVSARERPTDDDDQRRRYYRLSTLGRRIATAEAHRIAAALDAARAKNLVQPEKA